MSLTEHLGQGVYHVDTQYTGLNVASLYVLVDSDEVAIIETGTAHSLPTVLELLQQLSISPQQVKYVIPTHVHLDHAGGAGVMMQHFGQAQLVIHPSGARHMIDPSRLVESTIDVYGEETFKSLYGQIPPVDEARVIEAGHESSYSVGDRDLLILHTAGHAYHHFCVVDDHAKGIYTGDTFGLSYPNLKYQGERFILPTTTPTQFDPEALHLSIDLLMSHNPEQMYLTHFNVLPAPASHVEQYHQWVDRYVEMAQQVQPLDQTGIDELITLMGHTIASEFDLEQSIIDHQLANDIQLNCQGLAYWYRKHQAQ